MNVENCSNCGRVVGKLEQAYVFCGNVVCQDCHRKLTNNEDKQGQATIKKPIAVVIALLVLTVSLLFLVNYIYTKKDQLPALSEKDVKLIEAFVHETSLLDSVVLKDERTYGEQEAKFDAAYNDLKSFGSNNDSMKTMVVLALSVKVDYFLVRGYWNDGWFYDLKKAEDKASKSSKNFVEAYHYLQRRTTNVEFKKFLEEKCSDGSLSEIKQRDETTSK